MATCALDGRTVIIASASQTVFTIVWDATLVADTDVLLWLEDVSAGTPGAEVTQGAGAGKFVVDRTAGTCTLGTAAEVGDIITIERHQSSPTRLTTFTNPGDLVPQSINNEFDHFLQLLEDLGRDRCRSVRMDRGVSLTSLDLELPAPVANRAIGWVDATTLGNLAVLLTATNGGTLNTIPLWTPDGFTLGDSVMTQSSTLITVAGTLTVNSDAVGTTILGRAKIGTTTGNDDVAVFAHFDHFTTGGFAVQQSSLGHVRVNAPAARTVQLTINDNTELSVEGSLVNIPSNEFRVTLGDVNILAGALSVGSTVTAGSGSTLLTTAAGLLRHQAIDPAIAGTGITYTSGVLSADSGDLSGSGTNGTIPLWTPDGDTLGDSVMTQSGTLITVGGTLTVNSDTDGTTILGRAKIGSPTTDEAVFAHFDNLNTTDFMIRQTSLGQTVVNAKASQSLLLTVNNATVVTIVNNLVTITPDLNLTGNLSLNGGSLTSSTGAISFGNENISTTGTLTSGVLTVTGSATITGAQPILNLFETGGTADEGNWRLQANADAFSLGTVNDVDSTFTTVFNIERTGTTPDTFSINTALVVGIGGQTITAGSSSTVLTTTVGLLRHQAIDPSIAGTGLTANTGVLSVDNAAALVTLTDNSMADALHRHSELSASDGTPDAVVTVDAVGSILLDAAPGQIVALAVNATEELQVSGTAVTIPTNDLEVTAGKLRIGNFVSGVAGRDDLVISKDQASVGISMLSATDGTTILTFGDDVSGTSGEISYNVGAKRFLINTNGLLAMRIDSSQTVQAEHNMIVLGDLTLPTGDVEITGGMLGIGNPPTLPLDVNAKAGITSIGGIAIKLTNTMGSATVKGQLVIASTTADDAFVLADANAENVIGVILEGGVSIASKAWVVVGGIGEVLMDSGGCTRGDRIGAGATAGSGTILNLPSIAEHFQEIGHSVQTVGAGGLARTDLHFN